METKQIISLKIFKYNIKSDGTWTRVGIVNSTNFFCLSGNFWTLFVADAEDLGDGDRDAEQTQAEIHRDDQQQQQHVERVHLADATEHQLKTFPI